MSPRLLTVITALATAFAVGLYSCPIASAGVREYRLVIAQEKVNITGLPVMAMTINGEIPGPVLTFTEGDLARITVANKMEESTSIHWHGLLVPPGMDGVPYVSFPPIPPGVTFTYEFPIRQSGTYWYHSHSGLQEQSGLYGALVIHPKGGELPGRPQAAREHTVVLSDWTDRAPHRVLRLLKRGSHYFALEKAGAQSIVGAVRAGRLGDYLLRELSRMPAMDISDVAYDRFLANGKPSMRLPAQPGEKVRLRIINGSATTFFHLQFATGPMIILSADGQDVEPVKVERLLIGVAETYDVLVTMPPAGSPELRATAQDASAYASIWLGKGKTMAVPKMHRPDLYRSMHPPSLKQILSLTPAGAMGMPDSAVEQGRFDKPGMMGGTGHAGGGVHQKHVMGVQPPPQARVHQGQGSTARPAPKHGGHGAPVHKLAPASSGHGGHRTGSQPAQVKMAHPGHTMTPPPVAPDQDGRRYAWRFKPMATDLSSAKRLVMDGGPQRPWPPYAKLRALRDTSFDPKKPVRLIRLTLDGDMGRYIWLLNNRVLSESEDIRIKKGEVARFIMINRTMMHHPMHLHGHFFRVVNGQGRRAPLKHTVDVAPMSTTVIEFDANEVGDWFFHCHLLYHMKAGMARVVRYRGFTPSPAVEAVASKLYRESWYAWVQAEVLSSMSEGFIRLAATRPIITAEWEAGWQNRDEINWEGLVSLGVWGNRFFTPFIGLYLEGEEITAQEELAVVGLNYLLPLNLMSRVWMDHEGGWRVGLEKEFTLTPRLELHGEWSYDSREFWEAAVGLSYLVNEAVSLTVKWHSKYSWGAGITFRF